MAACGPDRLPPEGPPWTVRDSAGVPVVTNHRPAAPAGSWTLEAEPLLVLGRPDPGGEGDFGHPTDARFLPEDGIVPGGGLVVADGRFTGWQMAFLFDADGAPVARCGGAGQRPGELERLSWAAPYPGDSVATYDAGDHTLAVFGLEENERGETVCEVGREMVLPGGDAEPAEAARDPSPAAAFPGADGLLADGSVLVRTAAAAERPGGPGLLSDRRHELLVPAAGASAPDTLGVFPLGERWWSGRTVELRPFATVPSLVARDAGFAFAPGRPFEVRTYDATGRLERVIRRAWEPAPLSVADREAFVTWYAGRALTGPTEPDRAARERLLRTLPWPEMRPATSRVVVADDGSIWVEGWRWHGTEVPAGPGPTTWSVFSPLGRWAADVVVPGRFLLTDVRWDRVAGVWVDGRGGREVRVHRLVR